MLGSTVVQDRSSWRWRAVAAGLGLLCAIDTMIAGDRRVSFDIPRQVLGDALYAYSSATGIEILVPENLIIERRSAAISGLFTPEEALRQLLMGSGLVSRFTGNNAFTLVPGAPTTVPQTFSTPRYSNYSAALQAAVTGVLCRFRRAWPQDSRFAVRLWVAPSGAVQQVKFLDTTGDEGDKATLQALLQRMVVDEVPPLDLSQPTTLLILPRRDAAECVAMGVKPP